MVRFKVRGLLSPQVGSNPSLMMRAEKGFCESPAKKGGPRTG